MLRDFFLIAQPPLLGEEGNFATPPFGQHGLSAVAKLLRRSAAGSLFLFVLDLIQQFFDAHSFFDGLVVIERELRNASHVVQTLA